VESVSSLQQVRMLKEATIARLQRDAQAELRTQRLMQAAVHNLESLQIQELIDMQQNNLQVDAEVRRTELSVVALQKAQKILSEENQLQTQLNEQKADLTSILERVGNEVRHLREELQNVTMTNQAKRNRITQQLTIELHRVQCGAQALLQEASEILLAISEVENEPPVAESFEEQSGLLSTLQDERNTILVSDV